MTDMAVQLLRLQRIAQEASKEGLMVTHGLRTETEGHLKGKMISYVTISAVAE